MELAERDSDKPVFHVCPRDGWLNDPNGPIFYKGRYHIFYQHVTGSSTWDWGLVWGHASSRDLVHWEHEPIAVEPTPAGYDADGCWSGNVAVELDGTPTMLYTGVRLRSKESEIPLPDPKEDLDLEQIECQCVAECAAEDTRLLRWVKREKPCIPVPPTDLGRLTGFRDPFVFAKKSDAAPWKLIVGSGIKGKGGTILLYHSHQLAHGWVYKGQLEHGNTKACQDGAEYDLGAMWECPFFVNLDSSSRKRSPETWLLCVSPYPHYRKDRPTNPCLYWLGSFEDEQFQMGAAAGPKLLDLGDILYAPTVFSGTGRCIMVGWMQELRKGGSWDYAGCLSVPRVLSLQDGRLLQTPVEEINQLRIGKASCTRGVEISPAHSIAIEATQGQAFDLTVTFRRAKAGSCGIILRGWLGQAQEEMPCIEVLLLDWENSQLQIIAPDNLDTSTMTFDSDKLVKRIGGPILLPEGEQSLQLRMLIDHSLVEVFTELGQTLSTRVYRASPPEGADQRLFLFASGGIAVAETVEVYALKTIWGREEDVPRPSKVYCS